MLIVASSIAGHAQGPDIGKVNNLATAISHAEGFGKRGTIPTRYHNPGDLKAFPNSPPLAGQVRIGKGGHIVFKNDEAGKAALRDSILKMMDGRSAHFHPGMTLNQVARRYAEDWRPWVRIVSRELGVPPTTTLRAYFHSGPMPSYSHSRAVPSYVHTRPAPLAVSFRPMPAASPKPLPPAVHFPESRSVLDAVLDIPVDVPPLVEDDVPHRHRLQLLPALFHMNRQ
jgi:hypothetical protein